MAQTAVLDIRRYFTKKGLTHTKILHGRNETQKSITQLQKNCFRAKSSRISRYVEP